MNLYLPRINSLLRTKDYAGALALAREGLRSGANEDLYRQKIEEIDFRIKRAQYRIDSQKAELILSDDSAKNTILICSERFISRFGVDRLTIALAAELNRRSFSVKLIGQKFDSEALNTFECIKLPEYQGSDHIKSDLLTSRELAKIINRLSAAPQHTYAVVTGWPFIQSLSVFHEHGIKSFYCDVGVNPPTPGDYPSHVILSLIWRLKELHLDYSTKVLPISRYIAETQSGKIVDRNKISVIHLGSDHITCPITAPHSEPTPNSIEIFIVGRFETGNYKQAELSFRLSDYLSARGINHRMKALCDASQVPQEYSSRFIPLGFLSDSEMTKEISKSSVTACMSNWEGFNLPLVECQQQLKPCFVFDAGAHPEVVSSPYLLCKSISEMGDKLVEYSLNKETRDRIDASLRSASARFRWDATVNRYQEEMLGNQVSHKIVVKSPIRLTLVISNSIRDPGNSGVIRTTRQIARTLSVDPRFSLSILRFDEKFGCLMDALDSNLQYFDLYGAPIQKDSLLPLTAFLNEPAENKWVFVPEIPTCEELVAIEWFAASHSLKTCALFHDAIPVTHPEFVLDPRYRDHHLEYMRMISAFDVVLANSNFTAGEFRRVAGTAKFKSEHIEVIELGSNFHHPPVADSPQRENFILFVATLEPRKNHHRFLRAFRDFKSRFPQTQLGLKLVGNHYNNAHEILEELSQLSDQGDIDLLGSIPDGDLALLYGKALFCAYPSIIEGFGLPIVEAAHFRRAVICSDSGVMRDIGESIGHCHFVNALDIESMSHGIERLYFDVEYRSQLEKRAGETPLRTWSNYASALLNTLAIHDIKLKYSSMAVN